MTLLVGPFIIAAALLVVGGAAKIVAPGDTSRALGLVGLPAPDLLVRAGAGVESGIGIWAIATTDRLPAILVAASYLAFAAFVGVALLRGTPLASCGCFGREETPPTRLHVVVNLAACGVAASVAVEPAGGIARVLGDQPMAGIPFVLLALTGTFLAVTVLTALPRVLAAVGNGR